MARIVHYKRTPTIGLGVAVLALIGLAYGSGRFSMVEAEVLTTLAGGGIGTMFAVATVSVQNAVARHQLGTATGTYNLVRSLGSSLMVAVFGTIFLAGVGPLAGEGDIFARAAAARVDFGPVFRWVFLAAAAALVIALAILRLLEERPLHLGPPEE
jgi:sugar phosphate permease